MIGNGKSKAGNRGFGTRAATVATGSWRLDSGFRRNDGLSVFWASCGSSSLAVGDSTKNVSDLTFSAFPIEFTD
jgi:hypothetical protein